ncbi:hypothetical protein HK104_003873 [Borealophlyctis nickersoniae]|nr:hypothetical protein HK104_003873 [Borealophlyctis nickersoniae]
MLGKPQEPSQTVDALPELSTRAPFADNPTNGLVPLLATDVFLNRLSGWTTLVNRVHTQYEIILEHQLRLAESYAKLAKEFSMPVKTPTGASSNGSGPPSEPEDIFSEGETGKVLFHSIQSTHAQLAEHLNHSNKAIATKILPKLRSLMNEVRRKATDADKEWVLLDRELDGDRENYIKYRGQLKASLMRLQWKGEEGAVEVTKDVPRDPWVANMNVRRHIASCLNKQKAYRAELVAQCENFARFEITIIENLRLALSAFIDWRVKDTVAETDAFKHLKTKLFTLDPKRDWELFKGRHMDRIVERGLPLVLPKDLVVEGTEDPLCGIVKEGKLFVRDGKSTFGFRRSWKEAKVVLTLAGFLHVMLVGEEQVKGFPDPPELSCFLPDCVVGPLMANEKEPEEFVLQEKGGGLFGREAKHGLKGATVEESAEWWGLISQRVKTTANRGAVGEAVSPISPEGGTIGRAKKRASWLPATITRGMSINRGKASSLAVGGAATTTKGTSQEDIIASAQSPHTTANGDSNIPQSPTSSSTLPLEAVFEPSPLKETPGAPAPDSTPHIAAVPDRDPRPSPAPESDSQIAPASDGDSRSEEQPASQTSSSTETSTDMAPAVAAPPSTAAPSLASTNPWDAPINPLATGFVAEKVAIGGWEAEGDLGGGAAWAD